MHFFLFVLVLKPVLIRFDALHLQLRTITSISAVVFLLLIPIPPAIRTSPTYLLSRPPSALSLNRPSSSTASYALPPTLPLAPTTDAGSNIFEKSDFWIFELEFKYLNSDKNYSNAYSNRSFEHNCGSHTWRPNCVIHLDEVANLNEFSSCTKL